MSSGFSSKYGDRRSSDNNPDCYGDEDYYDRDDPECRRCPKYSMCGVIINRRKSRAARASTSRSLTSRNDRRPRGKKDEPTNDIAQRMGNYIEQDVGESDTFTSVLIYNASLNGVQGMLDTASHAWGQIPRKSYANVFNSIRKKTKK